MDLVHNSVDIEATDRQTLPVLVTVMQLSCGGTAAADMQQSVQTAEALYKISNDVNVSAVITRD